MRYPVVVAAAALAAFLAAQPSRAASDVIANIGSRPVTATDLRDILDSINAQERAQAANNPQLAVQLVRTAIVRQLLLEEAEKEGWDKRPDVAAQVAAARGDIIINSYVQAKTAPPFDYPSQADIQSTFDANTGRVAVYHLAQIFLADPPNATNEQAAAVAKKADDLARRAKARGADFAALARANSQDQATAQKGGDLGWLPQTQIAPEILGAVMALGNRGVTNPVRVASGWHIVDVLGERPAELPDVRDQLVTLLRNVRTQHNQQAYFQKLLDDSHVTVNETAAAALFAAQK